MPVQYVLCVCKHVIHEGVWIPTCACHLNSPSLPPSHFLLPHNTMLDLQGVGSPREKPICHVVARTEPESLEDSSSETKPSKYFSGAEVGYIVY